MVVGVIYGLYGLWTRPKYSWINLCPHIVSSFQVSRNHQLSMRSIRIIQNWQLNGHHWYFMVLQSWKKINDLLTLKICNEHSGWKSFTKSHFWMLSSRRLCNKGFKHSGWNYHWLSSSSFLFQLSFTSPSLNLFFWKIFQVASSPVIFILLLPAAAHSLMSTTK